MFNKKKIAGLLIAFIMIISTFSYATENEELTPTSETNTTQEETPESTNDETSTENQVNTETQSTEAETTPEIYSGDLYLFENDVTMDKYVDGNVYIIADTVNITGRVNGCLYVLANNVTLDENAYIIQSLYICADKVSLNGVANDLYASANTIDMSYNSFMVRDLHVLSNTFNFIGGVGRNAFVKAKNFNFVTADNNSDTNEDANTNENEITNEIEGEDVAENSDDTSNNEECAVVYGNLTYSSSKELELSKEYVEGDVTYSKLNTSSKSTFDIVKSKIINACQVVILACIVFLLASIIAPKFIKEMPSLIGTKSILVLGIGAIASAIALLVSGILLFIYVGIPLALTILGLYILMMLIASTITSIGITLALKEKFKFEKKYLTILTFIATTLILWALTQIPYVGWIIYLVIALIGFGSMIYYIVKNIQNRK